MESPGLVAPVVLARRIRMIMGDQKLSRKRLAELTTISRPSLASKLDAQVAFTYDELLRVVDALGVSWAELLADGWPARRTNKTRLRDFSARPDRSL